MALLYQRDRLASRPGLCFRGPHDNLEEGGPGEQGW